jgi:acetyl esterase/lipase
MQGRDDIIVPPGPSVEMTERLRRVGVSAALLLLPQADHGFDLMATNWSPAARQALWHAERFLALLATHPNTGSAPRKALSGSGVRPAAAGLAVAATR